MKIKPKIYAELLLESIKEKSDSKKVAANFWNLLQKNKQYRDLAKILDELEKVYAEKEGFVIAYVESGRELDTEELNSIESKLESQTGKKVIIELTVKDITGIIAKIEGKVIDLSVEDKISKLRKKLNQ